MPTSSRNGIESWSRPQYTRCQSIPDVRARRTIGRIAVMPTPPAGDKHGPSALDEEEPVARAGDRHLVADPQCVHLGGPAATVGNQADRDRVGVGLPWVTAQRVLAHQP